MPEIASSQLLQVPQATGQAAATPGSLQRLIVSLVATQTQPLDIFLPSFRILSLRGESTQLELDGACVNAPDGDCDGMFVVFTVGA